MKTLSRPVVWHWGLLDLTKKRDGSYEGEGLSVSTEPYAWRKIAKLGGLPLWSLRKSGSRFLDIHALTKRQRKQIGNWGESEGLVRSAVLFRVCYFDDEYEQELCFDFATMEEALAESRDDGADIQTLRGYSSTQKLARRMH